MRLEFKPQAFEDLQFRVQTNPREIQTALDCQMTSGRRRRHSIRVVRQGFCKDAAINMLFWVLLCHVAGAVSAYADVTCTRFVPRVDADGKANLYRMVAKLESDDVAKVEGVIKSGKPLANPQKMVSAGFLVFSEGNRNYYVYFDKTRWCLNEMGYIT